MRSSECLLGVLGALLLSAAHAQLAPMQTGPRPSASVPAAAAAASSAGQGGEARATLLKMPGLGQSVITVDALLRLENELALREAAKARAAAGLASAQPLSTAKTARSAPAPLVLHVESIAGIGDTLRADVVTPDGQRFANVRPGSRIKGCAVQGIVQRCVLLRPVESGGRSQPAACPAACWTGVRPPLMSPGPLSPLGASGAQPPLPPGFAPGGAAAPSPFATR